MDKLVKTFTLAASFCILFGFLALGTASAVTFSAETTIIEPGQSGAIPITMSDNSIGIAALTVPISIPGADVTIDSVSFMGSLATLDMSTMAEIDDAAGTVRISYLPNSALSTISAVQGQIAMVHVTIDAAAPDQDVAISQIEMLVDADTPQRWIRPEVADASGAGTLQADFVGAAIEVRRLSDIDDDDGAMPTAFALKQNYPNPFNPSTTIAFSLAERSQTILRVYNILGQEIETLVDNILPAGEYEVTWDADHRASGIYFYRLQTVQGVLTKKMSLLK